MPVDSTHPEYDANEIAWLRARDVLAGEDAVKAAGVRYLPRLDSQSEDEYAAYKARASFFNATARTADGFVGLIFRRESEVKLAGNGTNGSSGTNASGVERALRNFAEDVDLLGTPLESYAKNVVSEVISVGRAGTLVDWEGGSGASRTSHSSGASRTSHSLPHGSKLRLATHAAVGETATCIIRAERYPTPSSREYSTLVTLRIFRRGFSLTV